MNIDFTTPVGQVRLLISDVDKNNPILDDPQIDGYLAIAGGFVKLAAADALDAIATSEALVSKVIRTQDLATDGTKTAAALRAHAAALRARHDQDTADDESGFFEVAEFSPYPGDWSTW